MNTAKAALFPCLRGVMGDWVYYSTVMTPGQIANSILTSKHIREEKSLEDYLQRELKPRVRKIVQYLVTRESHFFNSIIVGVFGGVPDWYQFDLGAGVSAGANLPLSELSDLRETIGILRLTGNEQMFAIDGQHRTAAIAEAWAEERNRPPDRQRLKDDQFPVVLVAHMDDALGKKRTRRLFADINKKAVNVSKGDLAIIDEEDICPIVARRLYAEYRHFRRGKLISLTELPNLDPTDQKHFTNLLTLVKVNRRLKPLYRKKRGTLEHEEENVLALLTIATAFFDFTIEKVPDLKSFFLKGTSLKVLRHDRLSSVMRPIGLDLVARLYAHFAKVGELEFLKSKIAAIDFRLDGKHLDKLLWNVDKIEPKNATTAFKLCLYLLGQLSKEEEEELAETYGIATKNSRALPKKVA